MSSKLLSIGLTVALALSGGLLGKVGCQNMELDSANARLNKELMQANLELGRAETKFGDAKKYAGKLESAVRKEIEDRDAALTRVGELEARLRDSISKEGKTELVYVKGPAITVPGDIWLKRGMLYHAVTDSKLIEVWGFDAEYKDHRMVVVASVRPKPNKTQEIPVFWQVQLDLRLRGVLAEAISPSGAINNYLTLWELDEEGKDVKKFQLTKFKMVVEDYRSPHWYWWAPHLDIGALALTGTSPLRFSTGGSLGLSFMGYGLTGNDLEWRVLRVSADLSEGNIALGLTPAMYNLGTFMPLISNLWVGPHVSYGGPGEWKVGVLIGGVL